MYAVYHRRGTPEDLPSVSIMRVAMSVLGGSATSRLFRNVREKQSLCYYCGSRSAGHRCDDGRFRRGAGQRSPSRSCDPERTERPVHRPYHRAGNGRLPPCSLLSSLDSLGDCLGGLESWYYGQILRDEALAPPEYGKVLTSAVTRTRCARCCRVTAILSATP